MKIVFLSNFMNHHQLPLCMEFFKMSDVEFWFVATTPIPQKRLDFGYYDLNEKYDFIVCAYKGEEHYKKALKLANDADVVIIGSAPDDFIKERLKNQKLTFRYSERVYKDGCKLYELPARAVKYFFKHGRYKKLYMLCASAYTAPDYAKTLTFIGKTYKWGYFPEVKAYDDINALISQKKPNSLLWVGRMIDWKHPELAVEVARKLKEEGFDFSINILGAGELRENIEKLIDELDLQNEVKLLGSMSPEKVREYMEQSEIFLFTSDRQEGWGAVLNEAMNSACAVVSNINIGATPFLVKDGINGCTYKTGDSRALFERVEFLLKNREKRQVIAKEAYKTMLNEWNPNIVAKRFISLAQELVQKKSCDLYSDGPCSKT